ncbi:MAG: PadR family transcriptional regulator [Firmicutes bacterium]|nr:PadR family transcriptional regulator [Bacillota bacterium]MCL1953630.1 PadR family transcriptional regulator [Bacillota bacterium]
MASSIQNSLLKESVNAVVLKSLNEGDKESQDIAKELEQRSSGQFKLKVQSLNSVLQKLEKEGQVKSYLDAPIGKSKKERKLYSITETGKQTYTRQVIEYEYSRSIADKLLSSQKLDLELIPPLAPAPPKARRHTISKPRQPIDYLTAHNINPIDNTQTQKMQELQYASYIANSNTVDIDNNTNNDLFIRNEINNSIQKEFVNTPTTDHVQQKFDTNPNDIYPTIENIQQSQQDLNQTNESIYSRQVDTDIQDIVEPSIVDANSIPLNIQAILQDIENIAITQTQSIDTQTQHEDSINAEQLVDTVLKHSMVHTEIADQYQSGNAPQFEYKLDPNKPLEETSDIVDRKYQEWLRELIVEPEYDIQSTVQDRIQNINSYQTQEYYSTNTTNSDTSNYTFVDSNDTPIPNNQVWKEQTLDDFNTPLHTTNTQESNLSKAIDVATKLQLEQQNNQKKYSNLLQSVQQLDKGISVRPHNQLQVKEYKYKNYFFKNKLMERHFSLLFLIILIEVALTFAIVNLSMSSTQNNAVLYYIGALIMGGALPVYAAISKHNQPNRQKRYTGTFKLSMIYRIAIFVQLSAITILVNMAFGMSTNTFNDFAVSTILPIILATNIPLSGLIFNFLFNSHKYAIYE